MKLIALAMPLVLGACSGPNQNTPSGGATSDAQITALTLLMKNDINPAFSKLTVLVFHGEDMQEEPKKLRAEMSTAASALRNAMGQLRSWQEPPTETNQ